MSSAYKSHEVKTGDCINSIASKYGHFWETLWEDGANSMLKELRQDPNILQKGDVVEVRPKELAEEACATEQTHRFRRKGVPAMLRLRFLQEPESEVGITDNEEETVAADDINYVTEEVEQEPLPPPEPRADAPYSIDIDGHLSEGRLDGDGVLEAAIPPDARTARIFIEAGTPRETSLEINLGHLDPISEFLGVKQRLANLSFDCGDRNDEETEGLAEAITAFQEDNDMEVTGELSDEVRDKIVEIHGS